MPQAEMKNHMRIFTEVRFPVQVDLFDQRGKIIKLYWPDSFPHWRIENQNSIRFHIEQQVSKSAEFLIVDPKRFVYSVESPSTDNYFSDKFAKYFKKVLSIIKPDQFIRVGVRTHNAIEGVSFESFIAAINQDILFNTEFLQSIDENYSFNDISITLENDKSRVIFGPMKKDEKNLYLNEFVLKEKLADEFLFFDVDIYRKEVNPRRLLEVFDTLVESATSYPNAMFDYFKQKVSS